MSSFVAIKRILVTSAPRRVMNEIVIMETCRGCRHVAQLITAFGHEDQVLAVMPYQKSEEFKVSVMKEWQGDRLRVVYRSTIRLYL